MTRPLVARRDLVCSLEEPGWSYGHERSPFYDREKRIPRGLEVVAWPETLTCTRPRQSGSAKMAMTQAGEP